MHGKLHQSYNVPHTGTILNFPFSTRNANQFWCSFSIKNLAGMLNFFVPKDIFLFHIIPSIIHLSWINANSAYILLDYDKMNRLSLTTSNPYATIKIQCHQNSIYFSWRVICKKSIFKCYVLTRHPGCWIRSTCFLLQKYL